MIEYDKFQKALKNLEEQYKHFSQMGDEYPGWIREGIAESVIQRFEVAFDCMWKVLKRYLNEELGLAELPNSPKPLFRIANENNLFRSEIEVWFAYNYARGATSHDYDSEKAKEALEKIADFIDDAIGLYQTMTGETWD